MQTVELKHAYRLLNQGPIVLVGILHLVTGCRSDAAGKPMIASPVAQA